MLLGPGVVELPCPSAPTFQGILAGRALITIPVPYPPTPPTASDYLFKERATRVSSAGGTKVLAHLETRGWRGELKLGHFFPHV